MELSQDIKGVVTGGSSGLGEAVARALAAKGVAVTIFDLDADKGNRVAREINGYFCEVDVTQEISVQAAFEQSRKMNGQERILVNCAGIAPGQRTVSKGQAHDPKLFMKALQVNLFGVFLAASVSATGMATQETLNPDGTRGVIINASSIAAFDGQIGQIAYAASKAGVAGMTLPMARDLSAIGIRVAAIAPGPFLTPMLSGLPDEVQQSLGRQIPFPSRLGDPKEFASLVCHICENEMINGEVIRLDGAVRMAPS